MACQGEVWPGEARLGVAGPGTASLGVTWETPRDLHPGGHFLFAPLYICQLARHGTAWQGVVRLGLAGRGKAGLGLAWHGRGGGSTDLPPIFVLLCNQRGMARLAAARPGRASPGRAGRGAARQGTAWQGLGELVCLRAHQPFFLLTLTPAYGKDRHGSAGLGGAGQG